MTTKTRFHKLTAWLLTLAMLMTFMPGISFTAAAEEQEPTVIQSSTKENQNQAGGIIYTKTSTAKSDGTVDITLTAHTTGEVRQMASVSPTDIVLVLDVSGSMDENYTTTRITGYNEATGSQYTYTTGFWFWEEEHTAYGMESTSSSYYINTGTAQEPVYTLVSYTGRDSNGFEMYEYSVGNTEIVVYPELSGNITAVREHTSYSIVQFYSATTERNTVKKMTSLQTAVNSFIDTTALMNTGLETDEMHTISIVKFADDSYYNSSTTTIAEGNHTGAGGNSGYNYSEVVKNLTPVDATGAAALKTAVNNLEPGGATAVDYGLNLAQAVLMNRSQVTDENAVDRNEVVIVFTDGEPNHSSGFNPTVANTAIATARNMDSTAGATVYGVCIAAGADATDLDANINKFMHYMSSNYPNATNMDTPGAGGSTDKGYYMTPDESTSLSMIFQSIIQDIDHPTISLGEEATMVDTISPYFDFSGTVEDVVLMTSARKADGTWEDPVDDSNLSASIIGDRLTVDGFDFDENFVSETGRGDNGDFYGKRLVVSFTVVPDYGVIDAASATLMDGVLPTNSGFASLVDSDSAPAAEVETPVLSAHQVVYKVDDAEYKSYNRFTGSEIEVDAVPTKAGHTFNGWSYPANITVSNGEFVMPDEDVTITGTFTVNAHNVIYQYSGTQPDGAPALPATAPANFGTTITVAPKAELAGYVFTGWYPLQTDVTVSGGTFTMPDKDVTLVGYFESSTTTPYKVEHYLETLTDDVYEITPALVEDGFTGTTGHTVTATPLNRFAGFAYNETKSASTISGTIASDGSLILKVYYDRNEYKVTYAYSGDVPQDPPAKPNDETYKFGESVTVADNVSKAGYTFKGWESQTTDKTAGESFNMPAHDVAFIGEFTAKTDTPYKVEYYLQNIAGTDYDLDNASSYESTATTGATVYANHKEFEGFVFDDTNVNNIFSGEVAGDGSLVLKRYYNRIKYTVTYAYEGDQPDGKPGLPVDDTEYVYGATVTVKPDLALTGYNFAGWHSSGYTVGNDAATFTMPARNVILYGSFEPASGVAWKEEHYFEDLEGGTYTLKYAFDHTGTTGETAQAQPVAEEAGFEFDAGHTENITSATIASDGSTVLKFHYKRLTYNVSYVYDPVTQPAGAPSLPVDTTEYKFGQEVTVAGKLSLTGYDFAGWNPEQNITVTDNKFTMPAHKIVFAGNFVPRSDTKYEVHHHLMKADGTYPANPDFVNEHSGTTGATVPAIPRNFEGYSLNETESQMSGTVEADGSLVLDLFYDRVKYKVTYAFEGDIPAGVTQPTGYTEHRHGATVSVNPIPDSIPAGYGFVGWYRGATNNTVSGTFEMPMFDVHILGQFVAKDGVSYSVKHYLQNVDGTDYDLDSSEIRYGTTGTTVSAFAKEYPGFTYQSGMGHTSGEILGDGSLVLDFYYNRNTYKVTYEYEGITPDGTPAVPSEVTNLPFGKEITVAAVPNVPGYTFNGWSNADLTINEGKFTMPDKNVILKGRFESNLVDYKVNYWFQNLDAGNTFNEAEYTLDTTKSYTRQAYVGEHVEADAITHTGFFVNPDHGISYGHVSVDGGGVGNLVLNIYFDRHTYNITYSYYGEQPTGADEVLAEANLNQTNVRYGTTEIQVAEKLALTGYVFDGWYTRTANISDNKFTMPDHDVVFLGRFIEEYSVKYDLNLGTGAEGVDYSEKKVPSGTVVTVNAAPTRNGYNFEGWSDGTSIHNPDDLVTVTDDITFTAQWDKKGGTPSGPSGGTTKYTLTYETNGGNAIAKESYAKNSEVKLTKIPIKEGYVFDGWHTDAELTEDVTSVKMTKNITVYAAWVNDNGTAGNGSPTPDRLNGEEHFAYVIGYPDDTVRPNANISRAEVTTIFFRLLKEELREANLSKQNGYDDVDAEDWHNTAISSMTKLGIVNGRTADRFAPDAFITRAEFAAICARFDDSEFEVIDSFTDVGDHWAEDEIHEAAAHGWIRGYEDGTFMPDKFITRAEAMTMINRVLNRIPETHEDLLDSMVKWTDNSDVTAWYYLPIQEATNSHEYDMKNNIYEKWTKLTANKNWEAYQN